MPAHQDEDLRDTVFRTIFQKNLLFDTWDDAKSYRLRWLEHNKRVHNHSPIPTVYGWDKDGTLKKIFADGSLDPEGGMLDQTAASRLRAVFGQAPAGKDASFVNLISGASSRCFFHSCLVTARSLFISTLFPSLPLHHPHRNLPLPPPSLSQT